MLIYCTQKYEEQEAIQIGQPESNSKDEPQKHIEDHQQASEDDLRPKKLLKAGTNDTTDLKKKPRMEVKDVPFQMVQLKPVKRDAKASSPTPEKVDDTKVGCETMTSIQLKPNPVLGVFCLLIFSLLSL